MSWRQSGIVGIPELLIGTICAEAPPPPCLLMKTAPLTQPACARYQRTHSCSCGSTQTCCDWSRSGSRWPIMLPSLEPKQSSVWSALLMPPGRRPHIWPGAMQRRLWRRLCGSPSPPTSGGGRLAPLDPGKRSVTCSGRRQQQPERPRKQVRSEEKSPNMQQSDFLGGGEVPPGASTNAAPSRIPFFRSSLMTIVFIRPWFGK